MEKKYTVKDFCKKYNELKNEQAQITLVKSVMNNHYVPLENKVTVCQKIAESAFYSKTENNGKVVKKLKAYSPAHYMNFHLYMVNEYTNIDIDFSNSLEEFNILNKNRLFSLIISLISSVELTEFQELLNMVENDLITNEYEVHSFISKQVERFSELFGHIVSPAITRLSDVIKNMDNRTIENIAEKVKGVKDKFKK